MASSTVQVGFENPSTGGAPAASTGPSPSARLRAYANVIAASSTIQLPYSEACQPMAAVPPATARTGGNHVVRADGVDGTDGAAGAGCADGAGALTVVTARGYEPIVPVV